MRRCAWVNLKNPLYVKYHDEEWGKAVHDDKVLYEFLLLESFQAGLSWECILNKREAFRKAFDDFDYHKISCYDDQKIEELLQNKEIVRNNRDGSELSVIDIDENNLDDVILQDTRVFKLQGNLVNLLSENKKVAKSENKEVVESSYEEELEDIEINYEEMYKSSLEKIEELVKQNESLTDKLAQYQSIIDKIKEMVE